MGVGLVRFVLGHAGDNNDRLSLMAMYLDSEGLNGNSLSNSYGMKFLIG